MTDKLFGALSLSKRAGALVLGFDAAAEAAAAGKAPLILLANDLSPKTAKRILTATKDIVPVHTLPYSLLDLAPITRKGAGILAVTDKNLAELILRELTAQPPA